jgi:hypothetical protein
MARESWVDVPLVTVIAPACPWCRALKPIPVRSEQNGDGSVTRRCVCRECSKRFKLLIEIPNFGNPEFPPNTIPS